MAICLFFGHDDVYDPDIDNMLQSFEIFFVQSDGNGDFSWVTGSRLQRSQKAAIVEAAMLIDKKLNRDRESPL